MTKKLNRSSGLGEKGLFALAVVLEFAALICIGLTIPEHIGAQAPADDTASDRSGESGLRFEVASVKPTDPSRGVFIRPLTYIPGRYSGENLSLSAMAWSAYGLKEQYQIATASSWMVTKRYDLAATVPEGATIEQVHVMLQRLLVERFGLVVHRERRLFAGYRLLVAKGGAKLRRSVDVPSVGVSGPSIVTKNGITQFADDAKSGLRLTVEEEQLHGRRETMDGFAHYLVQALHVPVVDATGIEGEYNYDLSFEPPPVAPLSKEDVIVSPIGAGAPVVPTSSTPSGQLPTLFTVIKEQLGLQLESDRSIPIEVLVLDNASPNPTEN